MKVICLPYALEKIVRILSYITVMLLDIVHLILTPVTWIGFKSHVFMVLSAGAGYLYLHFIAQHPHAAWIAVGLLALAVLGIIAVKLFRKMLQCARQTLIRVVYAPVGVCFVVPSIFTRKKKSNCKKMVNCGIIH